MAGAGTAARYAGGGGGYGGLGGNSSYSGGGVYGSVSQPSDLGSAGGGAAYYGGRLGGAGGGAIRLLVGDTLRLDGVLSAGWPAAATTAPEARRGRQPVGHGHDHCRERQHSGEWGRRRQLRLL